MKHLFNFASLLKDMIKVSDGQTDADIDKVRFWGSPELVTMNFHLAGVREHHPPVHGYILGSSLNSMLLEF